MDVNLGKGLYGIDCAKAIMKNFLIPVIYVTAYNDEKTLERTQKTNPYGYINKPLRDTDLKTPVRFALDKNKQHSGKKDTPLLEDVLNQVYNLTPAESRVIPKLLDNPDVEATAKNIVYQYFYSSHSSKTHL